MPIRNLSFFALAAVIAGCGGHTLDVGSTTDGATSGDLGQGSGTAGGAGRVWNGTLENAQLSNGSNRLTMTLSVAPDGRATGTLLLGDGALLKPPTDPNVGYPPGAQLPIRGFSGPLGYFEGFPYTILDGRLDGSRLTFSLADAELWTQWCALQTPVVWAHAPDGGALYECVRGAAMVGATSHCSETDPVTMQSTPIDCDKVFLCQSYVCDCAATGCHGSRTPLNLSFDLTISGATADGTISGELGEHQVHFVRAAK